MRHNHKSLLLFFCLLLSGLLSAQELHIHELEKAAHPAEGIPKLISASPAVPIIPLQPANNRFLSTKIFGYLPYWEYPSAAQYFHYDLLTHIACFDFAADSLGNVSNPANWPWTDVINAAHTNGVKIILTISCFSGSSIHKLISTSAKQTLFAAIVNKLQLCSGDGVNIDFEGIQSADLGTPLASFMTDLSATVKSYLPNTEISFAGPAITTGWGINNLVNACDYVFIMAYDFYGSWSTTTGPVAPLTGGYYNVTNTVTTQYATVSNPQKLILGVPYYGCKWRATTNQAHAPVKNFVATTVYADDYPNALLYGKLWASDNQAAWYTYPADTGYYQVWFDTDTCVGLKYSLAMNKNYGGVGMWALGYDANRSELWNLLKNRFFSTSDIRPEHATQSGMATDFQLRGFPNPFNPSTTIQFSLPEPGTAILTVYNAAGKQFTRLFSGELSRGSHQFMFSGNGLSSGTYFVELRFGAAHTVFPILLLK